MTLEATAWAWKQDGISADAKFLLIVLSDSSSDHSPPPDVERAFAITLLPESRAQGALEELREARLIDEDNRTIVR